MTTHKGIKSISRQFMI